MATETFEEASMPLRQILLALTAGAITIGLALAPARAEAPGALTGRVSSLSEPAMEGVLVSAKRDGGAVTITVATDGAGRFSFPASKLEPGRYSLAIRAVGYELDGPKTAQVAAGTPATVDIKLRPTKNLAKQLTNAEWLASFPGTDAQKKALLNCISCHNLDRIVNSAYNAEEFMQVFDRMTGYYPGSTPQHPQRLIGEARRNLGQAAGVKAMAEYLASLNLSKDETWRLSPQDVYRGRRAARPVRSSPSTTCRESKSSPTMPSSIPTEWSGSRISASNSSASSIRRPAKSPNIRCR